MRHDSCHAEKQNFARPPDTKLRPPKTPCLLPFQFPEVYVTETRQRLNVVRA